MMRNKDGCWRQRRGGLPYLSMMRRWFRGLRGESKFPHSVFETLTECVVIL
jgi:hypothetical protein